MKLNKRLIFIIACALIIVIIGIVIAVSLLSHKTKLNGEDMPTKGYYQKSGKSIKVVLEKPSDKKHVWTAKAENEGYIDILEQSTFKKNIFVISKSSEEKVLAVNFNLTGKDNPLEVIYTIKLTFHLENNGSFSVIAEDHKTNDAAINGDIDGIKYMIVREDNKYVLYLEDTENTWDCENEENGVVSVIGPAFEDNKAKFFFNMSETNEENAKTATTAIYCEKLLKQLVVTFDIDEDSYKISSYEAKTYEIKKVISEDDRNKFEEENGKVNLPENALKIEYLDNKIKFELNEKDYEIEIFDKTAGEEDILGNVAGESGITKTSANINGTSVKFYSLGDTFIVAVWTNNESKYSFNGDNISVDDAKTILKEII